MPLMIFQEGKMLFGTYTHTWAPCQAWYLCSELPSFTLKLWLLEQLGVPGSLQAVVK